MIEEYRKTCTNLLKEYQAINDKSMIEKYKVINDILNNDACFFKLSIEDAFSILRDLGINENDIEAKYKELISYGNFKKLKINNN